VEKKREHVPVLLKEVIQILDPKPGRKFIDATFGFGGHAREMLRQGAQVLGLDWDPEVIKLTKERLVACPSAPWSNLTLVEANFAQIEEVARESNFYPVDGVLFDLGLSRWHYKKAQRGFSFQDQRLDMRLSPQLPVTALEIVNRWDYDQLNQIFIKLAQEKLAGPIAQALVRARRLKPIKSATELSQLVAQVYQRQGVKPKHHPATKVFLALRTVVNQELANLKTGLEGAVNILVSGGKLLVITFNSNEDRLVKQFLREKRQQDQLGDLKLIFPSREEISQNPLARSAQLRVAIRR